MRVLFLLLFPILLFSEKLILHVDVNKTIIAEDIVKGQQLEDVLIYILTRRYQSTWNDPEISFPITYYKYVKKHLYPNSDASSKQKRVETLGNFLEYLKETDSKFYPEAIDLFEKGYAKLSPLNQLVFPSFYRMLSYLEEEEIDYTLVLRSFGHDIPRVAKEINTRVGKDLISAFGAYQNGILEIDHPEKGLLKISNDLAFYELMKGVGHYGIQDHWLPWEKSGRDFTFGKRFPLSQDVKSIFFDDNVLYHHEKENVVHPVDPYTSESMSIVELIDQHVIVAVDPFEAILDDEYFVKKIRLLLEKE